MVANKFTGIFTFFSSRHDRAGRHKQNTYFYLKKTKNSICSEFYFVFNRSATKSACVRSPSLKYALHFAYFAGCGFGLSSGRFENNIILFVVRVHTKLPVKTKFFFEVFNNLGIYGRPLTVAHCNISLWVRVHDHMLAKRDRFRFVF